MSSTGQPAPVNNPILQDPTSEQQPDALRSSRPPFYARPAWRVLLAVLVFVGMLALFALLPSTYWRF